MDTLDRITQLLKQQHKKQIDLCNFIGIKKNAYTSWKNGANESYKKHIGKIAEFFGVSTDYLLGIEKEKSPTANSDETLMFALYGNDNKDITPEMLAEVRSFAKFVRENRKKDTQ